jgi:hypothetical protein
MRSRDEPEHQTARQLLAGTRVRVEHRKRSHDWYWLEPAGYEESWEERQRQSLEWFPLPIVSVITAASACDATAKSGLPNRL